MALTQLSQHRKNRLLSQNWRPMNSKKIFYALIAVGLVGPVLLWSLLNTKQSRTRAKTRLQSNNSDPLKYVVPPTPLVNNKPHVFDPTRFATYVPYDSRAISRQLEEPPYDQSDEQPYFKTCIERNQQDRWKSDPEQMTIDLMNWLLLEPVVGLNKSCLPPPLPIPEKMECKATHPRAGFSGRRMKPRKLGISIMYGFEVDVLELYLAEVYDVVDKIFLCESVRAHKGNTHKLLMWEHLKHQPRFQKYEDKVVHLILDDSEVLFPSQSVSRKNLFNNENNQQQARFDKFMRWNNKTNFFQDDDLIGFGDADEIPMRSTLQYLKYCELENLDNPIDIGSWLLKQVLNQTFWTKWHIRGNKHTTGDPTFHSIRSAKKSKILDRNRGRSHHFMLGGMHYSTQYFSPFVMMKMTHCTECRGVTARIKDDYISFLHQSSTFPTPIRPGQCSDKRGSLGAIEQYPWLLMCNPQRFKAVYGFLDDRLFLTKSQVPFRCAHDKF